MKKSSSPIINTLVGEGSLFKGELTVNEYFRLNGDFVGSLHSTGRVMIAGTGRLKGTIHAGETVVAGVVKGDIFSSVVVKILSSALVLGNVYAPALILEEGALLEGYASINPVITEKGFSAQDFQPKGYFSLDIKKKDKKGKDDSADRRDGERTWTL